MAAALSDIPQSDPPSMDTTWDCPPGFRVILGSQSSTRRSILSEMKIMFECISPNIDEKAIRFDDPKDLVLALARAKAVALMTNPRVVGSSTDSSASTTLLLTCDQVRGRAKFQFGAPLHFLCQVVVHNNKILEKPESKAQAYEFIR
jgi:septum formation protein